MSWQEEPITKRQKFFVDRIWIDGMMNGAPIPRFNGTTKGEASEYINMYRKQSHYSCDGNRENAGDRI